MSAHPPTAARLSSLSTTTLSQILELTRSHRLYLPPSPSLTNSIKKNLILHRKGIESLTASEGKTDVVRALGDQEERLLELLDGLGVVLEGVQRGKTGRLVDTGEDDQKDEQDDDDLIVQDDSGFPLLPINTSSSDHIAIDVPNSASSIHQMEEDEESMRRANSEVMQMQQQMMSDQDETLNSLSSAISRQHALSLNISSELELHEDLLEDTDQAIDRTATRLRRAGTSLGTVSRRARDTGSTGLIVLLVVILVVLLVVFKT